MRQNAIILTKEREKERKREAKGQNAIRVTKERERGYETKIDL